VEMVALDSAEQKRWLTQRRKG